MEKNHPTLWFERSN